MCQNPVIKFGSGTMQKHYKLLDMVMHVFFNALTPEQTERFFREFECDEHGNHIVSSGTPFFGDTKARDNWR